MPDTLAVEELRQLSDRLRAEARMMDDARIKLKMAEAALALAEIAEALSHRLGKP